jgi:CubicO group peptidase (beta-lactamase class C family)
MHRLECCFALLLATCLLPLARAEEPEKVSSRAPESTEELTRALEQVLTDTKTPGAGLAIVSRDGITFSAGVGLADRAANRKVTLDTMFRAGSISKSFTALAILKLQEAGRLKLDDRVHDLAPEAKFTNPWEGSEPLRLVHLLEHTAGFDEISLREFATSRPGSQVSEDINFDAQPRTSRWRPGRFFSYSNADYSVAGYVVEKVSGQSFDEYLSNEMLEPLDMARASFLLTEEVKEHLAKGYGRDGITPRPYEHIIGRPSGALNCTPTELAHLVQMLINRGTFNQTRILSAASIKRMETPTASEAARRGIDTGYGLGNSSSAHKGYRLSGHYGAVDGFLARYAYSTDHGVGFVLMLNGSNGEALDRCEKIILDYLSRDWPKSSLPESITFEDEQLNRLTGYYEPYTVRLERSRYLLRLMGLHRVTAKDGKLQIANLFGAGDTYLPTSTAGNFRRDKEPGPSVLFFEDDGNAYLASTQFRLGNLRRLPDWQFWGQTMIAIYCVLAMISALLFALVWIPRKLLGYLRDTKHLSVRVLPLLASLCLLGFFAVLFTCMSDLINTLARPTIWSIGICCLTLLFAALSVAGLIQVFRARNWEVNRWTWRHSLLVSIANVTVLGYLAYWGIIGIRPWL